MKMADVQFVPKQNEIKKTVCVRLRALMLTRRAHQAQRSRKQQSFTPDGSAVEQGGAQSLQPGLVAACLGYPKHLTLQLLPGPRTLLRTHSCHLVRDNNW